MKGPVERYILDKIKTDGSIHMTLIDPEKNIGIDYSDIVQEAEEGGTSAIMVGGSTLASNIELDKIIKKIKKNINIPIILFPNGPAGISPKADAVWFMSLLNSNNPYYFIDAQALAAPIIKRYGLEAIPMGYIILGLGGAAGYIGMARNISFNHPELVLGYSLAAEILGFRFIYLETGSGARESVPSSIISLVKKHTNLPVIVGGGIRECESAILASRAGADIIVTGTLIEKANSVKEKIRNIVTSITF
jgi:phosphoglycerol geranylgeranyltransferase